MLLSKRFDVNAKGKNGLAPLMLAAQRDDPSIIERLLKVEGINIYAMNPKGLCAIHYALKH